LISRLFALPALLTAIAVSLACSDSTYTSKTIGAVSPTAVVANVAAAAPTTPPAASGPVTARCGSGGPGIAAIQRSGQRKFDAPPQMVIDPGKTYVAKMETDRGNVDLLLAAKDVPNTVNNFVFLACTGFYDGLTFHRVEPGFVVQGGDPNGNGSGGPGYQIKLEISQKWLHDTGALAMARSDNPDSAGSQFYITLNPQAGLNGQYAVFGRVLTGMEVVRQIKIGDKIRSINIEEH
jgi:peptidylprolyl isomerase